MVFSAWALLGAGGARAEPVAVLGLASEDGQDALARSVTDALRAQASTVAQWEVSDAQPLLTQLTLAHDCEIASAACRAAIGEGLRAIKVIYGTTSGAPASGTLHVELMMFESSEGGIVGVAARNIPMNDVEAGSLEPHAAALIDELRGVQPEPTPTPAPVPGQAAESVTLSPEAYEEARADESSAGEWVGYGLLGTAALSLGLALYSWTQIEAAGDDANFNAYRRAVGATNPGVEDVCDEADAGTPYAGISQAMLSDVRDLCDSGRTFETLQYVFLGAAAVSGGVGLYLVLSGDEDESRAGGGMELVLTPRVGRSKTGVTATLRF